MRQVSILYIEHDSDRIPMKQALLKVPAEVDLIEDGDIKKISEAIEQKHYDLVITDAFFLPPGKDHDGTSETAEYKLDKIVKAIRELDKQSIRIAVLTEFSPSLLDNYRQDLKSVDYIWDKTSTGQDFLRWQVTQILDDLPRFILVENLLDLLVTKPKLPWSPQLKKMLEGYRDYKGETEQVEHLKTQLLAIANDLRIGSVFHSMFEAFQESDKITIWSKPSNWGHLRHAINVFWLGYYILNSRSTESIAVARKLFKNPSCEDDQILFMLNASWFVASIFHDLCLFTERLPEIVKRCKELIPRVSPKEILITLRLEIKKASEFIESAFLKLSNWADPDIVKTLKPFTDISHLEHGLLSATLLSEKIAALQDEKIDMKTFDPAFRACFLHSYEYKSDGAQLDFEKYPLSGLLLLCDNIQVWDRNTGMENVFAPLALKAAELNILEIRSDGSLNVEINYVPFRYLAPKETKTKEIESKLRVIISTKTVPAINQAIFDPLVPKLRVRFLLDSRIELYNSESKPACDS